MMKKLYSVHHRVEWNSFYKYGQGRCGISVKGKRFTFLTLNGFLDRINK